MRELSRRVEYLPPVGVAALLSVPILLFFTVLALNAENLPETDDYDAILHFLTHFSSTSGTGERVAYFFAAQHVQYKLWFAHAMVLLNYAFTGRVNFLVLQHIGNAFVLLIAVVLWLMFRPPSRTQAERLILFGPVLFLLFAPRYEETLDWAMCGLQTFPVLFFSLACLHLCSRQSAKAFAGACLAAVLAISSSLNGFGIALMCTVFFLQKGLKRWAFLCSLLTLGTLCLYAYHYTTVKPDLTPVANQAAWKAVLIPIAFLGGALGKSIAIPVGIVLLVCVAALTRERWYSVDPATMYATYFIILTGVVLGISRRAGGLSGAFASRYYINSQLLIILLYTAFLRMYLVRLRECRWARLSFQAFFASTLLFCVSSQLVGFRKLHMKIASVQEHYVGWVKAPQDVQLFADSFAERPVAERNAFNAHAVAEFQAAVAKGVYSPPAIKSH